MLNLGSFSISLKWCDTSPTGVVASMCVFAAAEMREVIRFIHIWPYKTLEERAKLRAKTIADGVWPPPGGPDYIATQQSDIYLSIERLSWVTRGHRSRTARCLLLLRQQIRTQGDFGTESKSGARGGATPCPYTIVSTSVSLCGF